MDLLSSYKDEMSENTAKNDLHKTFTINLPTCNFVFKKQQIESMYKVHKEIVCTNKIIKAQGLTKDTRRLTPLVKS